MALQGGEDYELLFSASPKNAARIRALGRRWECGITRIGRIEPAESGVVIEGGNGPVDPRLFKGYEHFGKPREKRKFRDRLKKTEGGGRWR